MTKVVKWWWSWCHLLPQQGELRAEQDIVWGRRLTSPPPQRRSPDHHDDDGEVDCDAGDVGNDAHLKLLLLAEISKEGYKVGASRLEAAQNQRRTDYDHDHDNSDDDDHDNLNNEMDQDLEGRYLVIWREASLDVVICMTTRAGPLFGPIDFSLSIIFWKRESKKTSKFESFWNPE